MFKLNTSRYLHERYETVDLQCQCHLGIVNFQRIFSYIFLEKINSITSLLILPSSLIPSQKKKLWTFFSHPSLLMMVRTENKRKRHDVFRKTHVLPKKHENWWKPKYTEKKVMKVFSKSLRVAQLFVSDSRLRNFPLFFFFEICQYRDFNTVRNFHTSCFLCLYFFCLYYVFIHATVLVNLKK